MGTAASVRWFPRKLVSSLAIGAPIRRLDPSDFSPQLQTRLLILQPTPFCNIDCDYCYLPERNNSARMSLVTVRQAAERLRDDGLAGAELTIVWHAGEPLAMPMAFYDEAAGLLNEVLAPSCRVSHSIQTNATLINDDWCRLFKRHGFRIGVSVDGPADLHDAHRRTRSGRGTHDRVLHGMAQLRAHDVSFHAIAVVTPATFAQVDTFFDFFVEQGVTEVGCNFDETEGTHAASSLAGHEADHAAFIARLLVRSVESGVRLRVRELSMALQLITHPLPRYWWQGKEWPDNVQTQPFALISVAHNGDFSSFSPELLGQPSAEFNNFILGNVAAGSYLDSTCGPVFNRLFAAIARGTRACEQVCAHFGFCGGGAPANKLYENGDLASAETLYCRTMVKRPFGAVLARLEQGQHPTTATATVAAGPP